MNQQPDYYNILGVNRNSSPDEIKKAYRKLALKYHPDRTGGDPESEKKFKEIVEAYEVLSNPEKKSKFDNPNPFSGFGTGFNPFDPFSGFRGSNFQEREIVKKGKNISARVDITLEEVLNGAIKNANVYRKVQCSDCKGTGAENAEMDTCHVCNGIGVKRKVVQSNFGQIAMDETCYACSGLGKLPKTSCRTCQGSGVVKKPDQFEINIPKGSVSGVSFRVPGKGDHDKSPSDPGDLIVNVYDQKHDFYRRDGINLICDVDLTFPEACLGKEIKIPNLTSGGEYKITIPPGTNPGKIFRVPGKGVPEFNNEFRGDILVKVGINVPDVLTPEQREFIEKYDSIF